VIQLTELQTDALAEMFNVGAGHAAASLSEIVGDEVQLSIPHISFCRRDELGSSLGALTSERLGAVSQEFSGAFTINASLLFTEDKALEIVREMLGSQVSVDDLPEFEQEAMCELGNIILNACMASISEMLGVEMQSTLPQYIVNRMDVVLSELNADLSQPVIMVLHIDLTIEKRETHGALVFLLSSASFHELIAAVDKFLARI
jgi:chemotaxis protein CheC